MDPHAGLLSVTWQDYWVSSRLMQSFPTCDPPSQKAARLPDKEPNLNLLFLHLASGCKNRGGVQVKRLQSEWLK